MSCDGAIAIENHVGTLVGMELGGFNANLFPTDIVPWFSCPDLSPPNSAMHHYVTSQSQNIKHQGELSIAE